MELKSKSFTGKTILVFLVASILLSFLLPAIMLGGIGFKLDLPLVLMLSFLIMLFYYKLFYDYFVKKIFAILILSFFSMFISDSFGNYYYQVGNYPHFPTEYLHFLSKGLAFVCFYFFSKNNFISERKFHGFLSVIFLVALLFGLGQVLNIGLINSLSGFYALTENQENGILKMNSRIFGVSGNILTWAGISSFIFIYAFFFSKIRLLKFSLLLLSFINLIFTASRSGLIALALAMLSYLFIRAVSERRFSLLGKYILTGGIGLLFLFFIVNSFFYERFSFLIERFEVLGDVLLTSGRYEQFQNIDIIFSSDIVNILFGIGKPVIDSINLMEVEFLFVFLTYGIVGVLLQYGLICFIVKKVISAKMLSDKSYFILVTFIYFIIFSFGYFFLREIYSGIIIWSVLGFVYGSCIYEEKLNCKEVKND